MKTTIGEFARLRTSDEESYNVMLITIMDKIQDDGEWKYRGLHNLPMKLVKTTPQIVNSYVTGKFYNKKGIETFEVFIQPTDEFPEEEPRTCVHWNDRVRIPYSTLIALPREH